MFRKKKGSFSGIVSNVAIASIALGVTILIVSYAILQGFNHTIQEKIFGFSGHIKITKFGSGESFRELPINKKTYILENALSIDGVKSISLYANKPALLRSEEGVQGIILKGIDSEYDIEKTRDLIVEGRTINYADTTQVNEIVISKVLASKMRLKLGDDAILFFVQDPPKMRKLVIVGIYKSDMEEFDEQITFGDLKLIQKLNHWGDSLVGGYEVNVTDFSQLDTITQKVYDAMDIGLSVEKITDTYYQLFDWFKLLETNINVLLIAILVVVVLNLGSSFTIIILERTNFIGTLKALGAQNGMIGRIFLFQGYKMAAIGLVLGNSLGIGFCYLQKYLKIIPLDEKNYYMKYVPIEIDWHAIFSVNCAILGTILITILVPAIFIFSIRPIRSIKFD